MRHTLFISLKLLGSPLETVPQVLDNFLLKGHLALPGLLFGFLFISKMVLLVKQVVIHQQALLYCKIFDLWDVVDDLSKPEEVLVAQHGLEDLDLLYLGVVADDLRVLKQDPQNLFFVYFVIQSALELHGDALKLFCISFLLVCLLSVIARFTQFYEVGEVMQDEITISVIDGDAQLVIIDILLNIINSKKNVLVFGKAHICSLARIYGKPYKANDSKYDGSPDPVIVVAAISLKYRCNLAA